MLPTHGHSDDAAGLANLFQWRCWFAKKDEGIKEITSLIDGFLLGVSHVET